MATDNVSVKVLRTTQRHSLIGIVCLFLSLCLVAGYTLVMDSRRSETIAQLSVALSQQREQFTDCTTDRPVVPASTCKEPVAEEPSDIVKESEETPQGLIGSTNAAPKSVIGPEGPEGRSAYQIAVENGFLGSELEWLLSLRGRPGIMGAPGLTGASAYQIARKHGFKGTELQWLSTLQGVDGRDGKDGINGVDGHSGLNGNDGKDGQNARGILSTSCQDNGDWLTAYTDGSTSISPGPCRGPAGSNGADGKNGKDGVDGKDGANGRDGVNGTDGTTCPSGSSGMDEVTLALKSGESINAFVCVSGS